MIGYLKGTITHLFRDTCFIDVHGVGYRVCVPASTLDTLVLGKESLLFTYLSVREDAMVLYGFVTQDEYDLFMLLLGVNGIGPKVALGILSAVSPDGFRLAVHQKNMKVLTKMPGVGKKTAERMILELHDKVGAVGDGLVEEETDTAAALQGLAAEALAALTGLGYTAQEVLPVLEAKAPHCQSVEELLKETLRSLGSGR